jgi:hypothetical protein
MRRVGERERLSRYASAIGQTESGVSIARGAAAPFAVRAWRCLLVGVLLALTTGCDKDAARPRPPSTASTGVGTDQPSYGPAARQPCTTEGEVKECGRVYTSNGDYLTCSVGHTTCVHEVWSACVGDHFVVKSIPALRLTSAGLKLMTLTGAPCSNACDPYCVQLAPDATAVSEVSAEGIVAADGGGVTLELKEITVSDGTPCIGLQCALVICGAADTTTISGRVFDPAGKNPLYNAEVYIPLYPSAPLPPFNSGASCDTCGGAQALDAIRATQSDANGNFTLSDVPTGSNVPVVVQMGKWRREIVLKNVGSCTSNVVTNNCTAPNPADCVFRLPRNQTDGFDPELGTYTKADMPQTAIISGNADPFDCLLLKAGIDPEEVGDSSSNKRIHYYASDSAAGSTLDLAYGAKIKGSALWNNLQGAAPNLMSYDVVLLPCEGGTFDKQKTTGTTTPYTNILRYANAGGRMFATHYGYSWLAFPKPYGTAPDNWDAVADWAPAKVRQSGTSWTGGSINTQDPLTGQVNTAFPKGAVFSQWLTNVSASSVPRRLMIHEGRQDLAAVGATTQSWMTGKDLGVAASPAYPNLFTYNTPYGVEASHQCGRVVYSDFHVSAAARTSCTTAAVVPPATVGVTTCDSDCLSDSDCGFTATCEGETPGAMGTCTEPCATPADCPNGAFSCNGAVLGTCEQTACTTDSGCGVGRTCQNGRCTCTADSDCNGGTCGGMTCDPTVCHNDGQCAPNGTCGRGVGATAVGACAKGAACHVDSECGPAGACGLVATGGTKGTCARTSSTVCHKGSDCDSNSCGAGTGATAGKCATLACHADSDCDSNSCGAGTGSTPGACAAGTSLVCHTDAQCDSGSCGAGIGATAGKCATLACHADSDCDSNSCGAGTGSTPGSCAAGGTVVCHTDAECDSNSCGAGAGSTAGKCATNVCHVNADCDSNSCGTGTGAVAGSCSTGAQICHAATDCDSGVCGASGSTGTCNTSTQICHANSDCDSNVCGATGSTGTCSVAGGTECHKASDCDSNVCGSGTSPSTKGTCAIPGGTECHKASDCDSNVCGSGTSPSTKGTCGGGASCTTATAAVDCPGGTCSFISGSSGPKRCSGACSADSNCGVGGVCSGAKCSAPAACSSDAACLSSKLCSGAKCTAPAACANDLACVSSKQCNGAKCSSKTCSADTACGVSGLCNNAKCSAKTCAGDAACPVGGLCNNAKCSVTAVCAGDDECPKSGVCTGAKCSTRACAGDALCSVSHLCNGAKCSATALCAGDDECPKSGNCTGAKCSSKACTADALCSVSGLCNSAKCSTTAVCSVDANCSKSGICSGAKCSTSTCAGDDECPSSNLCNNAKCGTSPCEADAECPAVGLVPGSCNGMTCSASDCTTSSDCPTGSVCGGACSVPACTSGADCASGSCVDGVCGCGVREDCGGSQSCKGDALGTCAKACTADAECAPDRCVNGQCGGCASDSECHDFSYAASCSGIPAANKGICSDASGNEFPVACKQGELSPQEKALEFMFFDLTACVSPDNLPPPKPVTNSNYGAATFVQDFQANCPPERSIVWREFNFQARIPEGTSIDLSAQSGDSLTALMPEVPVMMPQATASTDTGPNHTTYDARFIDTGDTGDGVFTTASPRVFSRDWLRLTIGLNPTADKQRAPRLISWKVQYDCAPSR